MKFSIKSSLLIVILLAIDVSLSSPTTTSTYNIPKFMKQCRKSDPKLNECLREAIESIRTNLVNGIPELLIPPCEPLSIPEIRIKQNAGAIRMESLYNDVSISGLSNFTLRSINADPKTNQVNVELWFPLLKMNSDYNIHGKVLLMPLSGNGTAYGNFTDIDATISMKNSVITKDQDSKHYELNDVKVDFNIGGAKVKLSNLFNGDADLGALMNKFLNDNWREITAEIRPALGESIEYILRGIATRLYEMYSIDQFLPD